ncbi:hemocyte protein-glutamine gamma-glutamyltransferase-like [Mercenaria mercenaria]|uniref:hemocyte protein-glutamine gamma-glutamyltransferase-like n=1 Tax=Mercenaria mercenaria TaxID=6596 RepID=UPI00234FB046|nr:hemocyte protein-glutamine gamma-glutamyltransferase-like [Mercenaria mercenaria]
MNKRDKYDIQPEPRASLTEKFASYYGNLRGLLLGSNLTGRRAANVQENPFSEDAQLTAYQKDKDKEGKEGKKKIPADGTGYAVTDGTGYAVTDGTGYAVTGGTGYAVTGGTGYAVAGGTGYAVTDGTGYAVTGGTGYAVTGGTGYAVTDCICFAVTDGTGFAVTDCTGYAVTDCTGYAVTGGTGYAVTGGTGYAVTGGTGYAVTDCICFAVTGGTGYAVTDCTGYAVTVCTGFAVTDCTGYAVTDGTGYAVTGGTGYAVTGGTGYAVTDCICFAVTDYTGFAVTDCTGYAVTDCTGYAVTAGTGYAVTGGTGYAVTGGTGYTVTGGTGYAVTDGTGYVDFHVWNESWCKRPDLPPGYDGWQAYDPTPQECLEGVFTCGPASVKAVRQGEIFYGYDTKFIFAEVNGDRVHWTVDQEGNMIPVCVEENLMGQYISTKAVSRISREDLTNTYKFSEDDEEKDVTAELARKLSYRRIPKVQEPNSLDVEFNMTTDMQRCGNFSAIMKIKNSSDESRKVDVHMSALSCRYTGIPTTELKDTSSATVLEPNAETEVSLQLKCVDYIGNVDSDSHLNLYAIAQVKETGQHFILQEPAWIEKPHLELKTEGNAHVGKVFDVVIKLINPLSVPLTGGLLNIEGPGMQRTSQVKVKKALAPGEELRETVQMKSRRLGRKEIIASFQCRQLSDVTGVIEIDVIGESRT